MEDTFWPIGLHYIVNLTEWFQFPSGNDPSYLHSTSGETFIYLPNDVIFYGQQFENLGTKGKNLCRILLNTCWIESLTYPTTLSVTHFSPVSSDKNPNFTPHPVDALTLQPFTTHIPTCVCFLLVNPESVFHRILEKALANSTPYPIYLCKVPPSLPGETFPFNFVSFLQIPCNQFILRPIPTVSPLR